MFKVIYNTIAEHLLYFYYLLSMKSASANHYVENKNENRIEYCHNNNDAKNIP